MFPRIATFIVCGAAASAVLAGSSVIDSGRAAVGGVVAEYAFDEGTGTLLHDASGNHNDGTIASASWTMGHSGTALSFNGSSSIVTVPGTSAISPTTAITIEAWVKPATTAGWRAIAVKEQTPSALSYGLYSSSDAGPASLVYTSSEQDLKGASRIPVGAWSYLAAVYDGSVNRVYVNGSLVAQSAVSGSIAESGGALRIGGDTIWNEWFNGSIDDVRIYSRVLTAAEINSDMTTAVPSSAPSLSDTTPPSTPASVSVTASTQASISLGWTASSDNVAVAGYGVYQGTSLAGSTASTSYTRGGLGCGTSYSFSVDAYDAAGNRSGKQTITAATARCTDTQPPSIPGALTVGAASQSSIPVSWSAASDNVGVAGYDLYLSGVRVASTGGLSYSFAGLSCGTSYSVAVDAFDASGNRSAQVGVIVPTIACPDIQPPTAPSGLSVGAPGQTSVTVSWSASMDNVGVVGYGAYLNGASVGSTSTPSYTLTALSCATSYTFSVDAVDAAGNRSTKTTVSVTTAACATGALASLWVDGNGGSCTRQGSAVGYVDAQACGSFQAAYSAAHCADIVGVKSGTYATQSVSTGSKACTSTTQVVFTSVPGGTCSDNTAVTMPSFAISVAYVQLACMNANPTTTTSCINVSGSSGQHSTIIWTTLDHVAMHCGFFDSDHLRVTYSTFGPDNTCQTNMEDLIDFRANTDNINDVVFDHDTFKTVTAPPDFQCGVGKHVDSMQGYGMSNFTLSNSNFYGCPGQCIIFRPYNGGVPGPFTFVNNIFDQAQDPGQAIDIGSSSSSDGDRCNGPIVIQNNTFVNGAALHGGCWNNPVVTFRNNIMTGSSCGFGGSNVGYAFNVFYGGSGCGTSSKSCIPAYVGATSNLTNPGDFHLAATDTCARDAADQTAGNYPTTDFDGQPRPQGSSVDAGADEVK